MKTLPTRHPWIVLSAILLLTAFFGRGLSRLETTVSVDEESLPRGNQRIEDYRLVNQVFGSSKPVTVVVDVGSGKSVFGVEQLALIDTLSKRLARHPDLVPGDVTSLTEVADVTFDAGALDSRRIVAFPLTRKDAATARARMLDHPLWPGRLFDHARQRTIITSNAAVDVSLDHLYDELQRCIKVSGATVVATGGDVIPVALTRAIDRDMQLFVPLALLLVVGGLLLCFRSVGGVLLPLGVTVLAMIWLLGLMGLVGASLDPVTTVLPPTLIALGSSYGIHYMNRYYGLNSSDGSTASLPQPQAASTKVAAPLVMAGATTALGMATLVVFEIDMIRTFGWLMALGILFVVLLTLTFIPAVLTVTARRRAKPLEKRSRVLIALLVGLSRLCRRRARAIVAVTILLSLFGLLLCLKLQVGVDLVRYFPHDHPQQRANRLISEKLGGAAAAKLMIEVDRSVFAAGTREPVFLAKLSDFAARLREIDKVGHVRSLADVVYHLHRRIQTELAKEAGKNKLDVLPPLASSRQVDQLLLLYAMGAGAQGVDKLEDAKQRRVAVTVAMRGWDAVVHRRIIDTAQQVFRRTFPRGAKLVAGGDASLLIAFDHYIVKGKLLNIALTVLLVFLLCGAIYRSLRLGLFALIPVSFATVATFALMSLLGFRLTMATVVISSIGIGVGIDFAVHFLDHVRHSLRQGLLADDAIDSAMREVGPAVVYDASSNVLGFAPLVLSMMVPVQHFGWLISLCMVFSALATLVVLPAALQLSGRRLLSKGDSTYMQTSSSEVLTT
jgi:predicted RND superfamily exporter protein